MHVAIRRFTAQSGSFDEGARRVENEFLSFLSSMPGFVEYDAVRVGEHEGWSISFFETQEQAEESNRRAAEWVKENVAPLAAGPHEIVAVGEVLFRKVKQAE
jgi:hypothetical protein